MTTFDVTLAVAAELNLRKTVEGKEVLDLEHKFLTVDRNKNILAHYQGQVDRLGTIVVVQRAIGELKGQNRKADRPQNDHVLLRDRNDH